MERSLYWYKGSLHILTNTYTAAVPPIKYNESVFSSVFNRAYSIRDGLTKENVRIKQLLKKNGYQESIISKIFKGITDNHSLPQSQQ